MIEKLFFLFLISTSFLFALAYLRLSLHRFQQAGYRANRYINRLFEGPTGLFYHDRGPLNLGAALFFAILVLNTNSFDSVLGTFGEVVGAFLIFGFAWISYQRLVVLPKQEKKPLVFTSRVVRLYAVSLFLVFLCFVFMIRWRIEIAYALAPFLAVTIPIWFLAAHFLLVPLETQISRFYLRDAAKKRRELSTLRVIGITGSYGKTSVKHAIEHVLSQKYLTLMTPGSINTELGIARIIREQLKRIHEVFIAEMGAREIGDIHRCCEVAQPQYGVITTIGTAHLEMFGSQENILKTKSELARYIPNDGVCFLNADNEFTPRIASEVKCKVVTFGIQNSDADIRGADLTVTSKGTEFNVYIAGVDSPLKCRTALLGSHNIVNVLAAIAVAVEFGIDLKTLERAVATLKPVQHRLALIDRGNGILVIDDAFNSNPVGFREAIKVLSEFKDMRKILVTPGMVELGQSEFEENKEAAKFAAKYCDYIVLVGSAGRVHPLKVGLKEAGFAADRCFEASSLAQAQAHLATYNKPGDIILFENDLPDLYQ